MALDTSLAVPAGTRILHPPTTAVVTLGLSLPRHPITVTMVLSRGLLDRRIPKRRSTSSGTTAMTSSCPGPRYWSYSTCISVSAIVTAFRASNAATIVLSTYTVCPRAVDAIDHCPTSIMVSDTTCLTSIGPGCVTESKTSADV